MTAELIVVSGPPGSGKSTVSGILAGLFDPSVLVAGDEFFGFLRNGRVDPWMAESASQNATVIAAAAASCGEFCRGGYAVVYDGVVGPWFIGHFLAGTGLQRVHYALLLPDEETCVGRVRSREAHPFDDVDATRHMHRQFAAAPDAARYLVGDGAPDDMARAIRRSVASGGIVYPPAG